MRLFVLLVSTVSLILPARLDAGGLVCHEQASADTKIPRQRVIVLHAGDRQTTVLSLDYEGNAREAVWLIPTPSKPEVKSAPRNIFHDSAKWLNELKEAAGDRAQVTARLWSQRSARDEIFGPQQHAQLVAYLRKKRMTPAKTLMAAVKEHQGNGGYVVAAHVRLPGKGRTTLSPISVTFQTRWPVMPIHLGGWRAEDTELRLQVICERAEADPEADPEGASYPLDGGDARRKMSNVVRIAPQLKPIDRLLVRYLEIDLPPEMQRVLPATMPRIEGIPRLYDGNKAGTTVALLRGLCSSSATARAWFEARYTKLASYPPSALPECREALGSARAEVQELLIKRLADRATLKSKEAVSTTLKLLAVALEQDRVAELAKPLRRLHSAHGQAVVELLVAVGGPAASEELGKLSQGKGPAARAATASYIPTLSACADDVPEESKLAHVQRLIRMLKKQKKALGDQAPAALSLCQRFLAADQADLTALSKLAAQKLKAQRQGRNK